MNGFTIRPLERSDREWVAHFLDDRMGNHTDSVTWEGSLRPSVARLHGGESLLTRPTTHPIREDVDTENIGLITTSHR